MPLAIDTPDLPRADLRARIVAHADQCVKCGLCQPQCPTYGIAQHEADSPRGRIALAKALASDALIETASAREHLDRCLACLRCERVCPSGVRYGELIVDTRALLRETAPARRAWWQHPAVLRSALRIGTVAPIRRVLRSRVLRPLWAAFGLQRAVQELPELPRVRFGAAPKPTPPRGRVGLFLGCVARVADRDVHTAARRLLAALDYEVVEPRDADCCGALSAHAGDAEHAAALAAQTRRAFDATGVDTVLVSASGCFGSLRDLAFAGSSLRVREIHEFLAADTRLAELKFRPLPRRAALHTPCTQANVARADGAVRSVLRQIPQLDIVELPAAPGCCGAAGDYFLRQPAMADALRTQKLDQATALAPDFLVTSNVGCRIFLGNGLRERGAGLPVLHPVALLAQQLDN